MKTIAVAVLLTVAGVAPLAAEPAHSMVALAARVKPGTQVDIVDRQGVVLRGDFVRADGDGVLLAAYGGGQGRRVPISEVMTVTRHGDSLWNGTLIGAGTGAVFGLLIANADDGTEAACYDNSCKAGVTATTAVLFGGIGLLLDVLIKGHSLEYVAPAERVSWSVSPHPVRGGAGVRVAVRF